MPTSVKQLFNSNGKEIMGQVKWGQRVNCQMPGVYVVAMATVADEIVCYEDAPVSKHLVEEWINYVPQMLIDNQTPTPDKIVHRLKSFWLPDETILYIGMTTASIHDRVYQYYKTKIWEPSPHHGGHWIRTLENYKQLNIYWTTTEKSVAQELEHQFLNTFVKNTSNSNFSSLHDPSHPFPFANLEFPKRNYKAHGIKNSAQKKLHRNKRDKWGE